MSFPRYRQYKDSDVGWLGPVPVTWRVAPLKVIARVINGYPFDAKLFDPADGLPLVRIRDLNQYVPDARYKGEFLDAASINNEDVLIGMDGDFNVGRWLGEVPALLNQRMCCVRADSPMVTRYLEYVLPQPLKAINDVTYSTTVKHLSSFDVLKISVAMPPASADVGEIVGFLDRETAKIDSLVEEQRRLIELLKEKRQAVISRAVTKGLNPNAPMRDSGAGWIGQVPQHWRVSALGYAARIDSGSTPDRANPNFWGGSIPWVKTGEVNYDPITQAEECITEAGLQGSSAKVALPGTLLMAMYGQGVTRGRVALLEVPAAYNQACAAIHFDLAVAPSFGRYFFMAAYEHVRDGGNETSQMNLSTGAIQKFKIAVPPTAEQHAIVAFLDRSLREIELLIEYADQSLILLSERRSALISAAVTGKIDVRGLVPQPEAVAA